MIQPGVSKSFDMVEATIKLKIKRMSLWADIINTHVFDNDPDVNDLYQRYIDNAAIDIRNLVTWCWEHGYIDRSEASKITHWMIWFNFPEDGNE